MFVDDERRDPLRGVSVEVLEAEVLRLHAERCRLDADEAAVLIEVERRRSVEASPFRDTAAWLRNLTGIARSTARTRAEVARQLGDLPLAHKALAMGQIGFDHARSLADHAHGPNRDQVLDDQLHLNQLARRSGADRFRDQLAAWARDLDAQREAGLSDHERQLRCRGFRRWRDRDGTNALKFNLDDETTALVCGALGDLVSEEQRAERGTKLPPEARRSSSQRWADALGEMARRSRAADVVTRHKVRPTIIALADADLLWDQLKVRGFCQLADGTKITARQLRRLACEADIIPMVLDSDGVPLDMGRKVRLATDAQRLALRVVHDTCAVDGCDVPFDWCEIHHLRPWEKLGATDLANLVPLCSYHHHLFHEVDWPIQVTPDRKVVIGRFFTVTPTARGRRRHHRLRSRPPDRVPARM
jgi:Domain of unknown function (DUF222)/HNH endonuclease